MDTPMKLQEKFQEELDRNGMLAAAGKMKDHLKEMENVTLNIAITGEAGSGKSSFVNAFRRLGDEDEGSAPTGVVETTKESKDYPHPDYPNVHLWDLPGMGTLHFPAKTYLEQVQFERYDFFIIISNERFKENDVKLALEIQKKKKKFYFVRSKFDSSLESERRKKSFNEEETKKKMKDHCIEVLEKQGITSPTVFLISSFHLDKYDFTKLVDKLEEDLPFHKRNALLTCLPNLSLEILQKKKKYFQSTIWIAAAASAAGGLAPVPGLSVAIDVAILVVQVTLYYKAFGLDSKSRKRIADRVGLDVEDLKSVMKSPLSNGISTDVMLKLMTSLGTAGAAILIEEGLHFLPIIGSILAAGLSFGTTYTILNKCLNELAEDAGNVLMKVLKRI